MIDLFQKELSQRSLALKAGLGGLIELVESWVISLETENERFEKLVSLKEILENPDCGLKPELATTCRKHLTFLLEVQENVVRHATAPFRRKLKQLFHDQIDKIHQELDQLLKQVGRFSDSLEDRSQPAGGLIMAQEDERKRISREIHDGPAQSLASLTMKVDFCLEQINSPEVVKRELTELKESIIRSLKDIRRFIFDLRPMALDDLGLVPTLEQFLSGFRTRTSISVNLHVEGDRKLLSSDKELAVFRVIQEAVNNAGRHARPKVILVFLSFDEINRLLNGVVKDDGIGFDLVAKRKAYATLKKLGLISMEERVKLSGGEFHMVSAQGEGTLVSFKIPLEDTPSA